MKERKAHRGWIPALMLALIAGAAGAPAPASGAPVATPPAPPPRSVEVAATIDLSTTTLDGPGFTATGSTPAYASPGGAVANPNRTLTFTADAHGKTYVLKQTGMRAAPPDPKAPREATSIFSGITFASGIDVTLVARSIDQSAITLPDAATSLTLLLDG
ncbi:MAG: hypothetical protein FWC46_05465, partial [Actinomycetia bacterium]|nr:hypothetical protein [Actinomycetes bacterium]